LVSQVKAQACARREAVEVRRRGGAEAAAALLVRYAAPLRHRCIALKEQKALLTMQVSETEQPTHKPYKP
jgi:hypothetical protein